MAIENRIFHQMHLFHKINKNRKVLMKNLMREVNQQEDLKLIFLIKMDNLQI